MTEENLEVKIYMKDGKTKFGILLNGYHAIQSRAEAVKFICNSRFQNYLKTANHSLIELLPYHEINAVETDLR